MKLPSILNIHRFNFFSIVWLQNAGKFSDNVILMVQIVQASTGVHPSSYSVGARGCLPWITADSHVCRAEVKNKWSYISTPLYACMV
jgi:hypothetical protein